MTFLGIATCLPLALPCEELLWSKLFFLALNTCDILYYNILYYRLDPTYRRNRNDTASLNISMRPKLPLAAGGLAGVLLGVLAGVLASGASTKLIVIRMGGFGAGLPANLETVAIPFINLVFVEIPVT